MGLKRGILAALMTSAMVAGGAAVGLSVAQAGPYDAVVTTGSASPSDTPSDTPTPSDPPTTTTPPTTPPTSPPAGGEWCSPGFWKNNPLAVAETGVDMSASYNALFDPDVDGTRKGGVADPTLQQVLDKPQHYGGEAFNTVGDLLSGAHPDVDFDGTRVEDSCPLSADASRK